MSVHMFGNKIQQFYGGKGSFCFEGLYQQVNQKALAPFFCSCLNRKGLILDAGSGSGHLAEAMGLSNACFLDFTWEQIKRCREKGGSERLIQGDIQQLPFHDNIFDEVICSNVLHYTGSAGLKELIRVTKPGGQLLLAFLESSELTRIATNLAVFWGIFPQLMRDAQLLDLKELDQPNLQILDSATVVLLPPYFRAQRKLPRQGLVPYVLKKLGGIKCLH